MGRISESAFGPLIGWIILALIALQFLRGALGEKIDHIFESHGFGLGMGVLAGVTTMIANADAEREKLADLNEMIGPVFKIANDPRVTQLGKFLRKYSLNELPQLWSVLKGDMSLVGPRPAGPHELQRYELWHKRKLSAKPGITCFWQVRGRNSISNFDDWVRLDLEYIQTRSFWVDCKILARTAWVVVRGTGS